MRRAALTLAILALAVNGPRLVLAFLEADALEVPPSLRGPLLALTGISTGLLLTGGGAFLAYAATRTRRHHRLLRLTWALVLTCAAILITPMLVAGLAQVPLSAVLHSPASQWTWALIAVLAVELVAGGAMVAHAGAAQDHEETTRLTEENLELGRERNRLEQRLRQLEARLAEHEEQAAVPDPDPVPCRHGCGFVGKSAAAERGHQARCPVRDQESDEDLTEAA